MFKKLFAFKWLSVFFFFLLWLVPNVLEVDVISFFVIATITLNQFLSSVFYIEIKCLYVKYLLCLLLKYKSIDITMEIVIRSYISSLSIKLFVLKELYQVAGSKEKLYNYCCCIFAFRGQWWFIRSFWSHVNEIMDLSGNIEWFCGQDKSRQLVMIWNKLTTTKKIERKSHNKLAF